MTTTPRAGALAPYRVLDLADEKGVLATKLFGDLGADVIKVEPPGGDPLRRLGPFLHDDPHPEKSLYWLTYNTGKRSVTLDITTADGQALLRELAQRVDVLFESYPPGHLDSLGLGYAALRTLNPRLVYVSVTPFGQDGPYAHYKATDLIGFAMGGLMFQCGDEDRAPVRITTEQAYAQANVQAAAGAMIALYAREVIGEGQWVDQSMQEAVAVSNDTAHQFWDLNKVIIKRMGMRRGTIAQPLQLVWECADGYVAALPIVGAALQDMRRWMLEEGEGGDLADSQWDNRTIFPGPGQLSPEEIAHLEGLVAPFFQKRTKAELYAKAQRRRVYLCPVSTVADLFENPQVEARQFLTPIEYPEWGVTLKHLGGPYKLSATPWQNRGRAPRIGEHNTEILGNELGLSPAELAILSSGGAIGRRPDRQVNTVPANKLATIPGPRGDKPFAGLAVADFAWVGVGPITSKYLADHGAEVFRIESIARPEVLRFAPPFAEMQPGLNRSGYFANYNGSKRGVALNCNTEQGREVARKIIAQVDVVTESFTPRAMRKWGLTYHDLRAINPDLIMISLPLFGQTGPHAEYLGYGHVLQAVCGVNEVTGWPDRAPVGAGNANTDFFVPHLAAFSLIAALDHRRRTGEGQHIDFGQFEAGIYLLGPYILDYAANGRVVTRLGNRHPYLAPHGVYRCQGEERWLAIAVTSDAEWQGLCAAIGSPAWTREERFGTLRGRKAHEDDLDRLLGEWAASQEAHAAMRHLQAHGVPAGVVQNARDLHEDPQLVYRHHYWFHEHPEIGYHAYDGPSFRLSATPGAVTRPAPQLGQHTEEVLKELGLSDEEYVELLVQGGVLE